MFGVELSPPRSPQPLVPSVDGAHSYTCVQSRSYSRSWALSAAPGWAGGGGWGGRSRGWRLRRGFAVNYEESRWKQAGVRSVVFLVWCQEKFKEAVLLAVCLWVVEVALVRAMRLGQSWTQSCGPSQSPQTVVRRVPSIPGWKCISGESAPHDVVVSEMSGSYLEWQFINVWIRLTRCIYYLQAKESNGSK